MPFKPGQSGNPGGRPKALMAVINLAREHTEASIAALAEIRDSKSAPDSARIAACVALLDRGWGKPTQPFDAEDNLKDSITGIQVRFVRPDP
jgi:hypothetical protein